MAPINLGNVVGIIASTSAPTKKYIWWFHILDANYPTEGILKRWDESVNSWVPGENSTWLGAIDSYDETTPPVSPTIGDSYLISNTGATGAWTGKENNHAIWLGHSWLFTSPRVGARAGSKTAGDTTYYFNGTIWALVTIAIPSFTFENALIETSGNVVWNGALSEDTIIDSDGWDLVFQVNGVTAIDVANRLLRYSDGSIILDWSGGYLRDADELSSVAWKQRILNIGSTVIVDWENGYYNDASGNPMFRTHAAFTTTNEMTADFENGRLYDYTGNVAVSWTENGAEGQLFINGDLSVDWANRQLLNSAEVVVLDWSGLAAYRNDTSISIDWEDSILHSSGAVISIAWEDHIIWNRDGIDFIDYSGDDGKSILKLESTTKAFLPPRMTTAEKNAIPTPEVGSVVIDTTLSKMCVYGATGWETITSI